MKVALLQQEFKGTKEATIAKTLELIAEAKKGGADLVVCQELHQTRYFCQSEDTNFFDHANEWQEDVAFWGRVAKENGVVLVTSLFEKRADGLYHNTAFVFERDGSVAGKYRKMHIPDDPGFYEKFYFTPGDIGFEPIETSLGKLGVLVCWDQWYPEAARLMALKGAKILIYPTAIGWFEGDSDDEKSRQLEAWVAVQRGHSVANGLPVVAVNRVGFESTALSEVSPDEILSGGNEISVANDGRAASDKILRSMDASGESKILSEGGILSFNNGALTGSDKMAIGGEILPAKNEAARGNLKISIEIKFNGETLEVLPNKQRVDQLASEEGIRFWGNSFVFGAQGEQLFRANSTDELCEVVTIDMQRCENVRRWWPFLRDRRVEEYGILTKRYGL